MMKGGLATAMSRKYRHFRAIVGLADSSPSGDEVYFSLLVDGQLKGPSPILTVGDTMDSTLI
jgi:hypothetical protein